MTTIEKAAVGTVSWVDLQTPEPTKARKFYGDLLGWSFQGGDDPNTGFYAMATVGGRLAAGVGKSMNAAMPSVWSVYFATDHADETAKKVEAAGGKVVMAPMDVMDAGRMAVFCDPAGAHFGVWQANKHEGAQVENEPGAMAWHEVYSRDVKKAREFYAKVFGLEPKKLEGSPMDYWTLHKGPKTVCGSMQMNEMFPKEVPSHWNTYFAVPDADAAAKKVTALGGKIMQPPFDTPYGRMTAVVDPFGAHFCLVQLARP
jgi:predicted enzyme related to lactoylglutathione lyase